MAESFFENREDHHVPSAVCYQILRGIVHECNDDLAVPEYRLLTFILGRTLYYEKDNEYISYRDIQSGVFHSHNGLQITGGTGLGKDTIAKYLRELVDKELIVVSAAAGADNTKLHITVQVGNLQEFLATCATRISKKFAQVIMVDKFARGVA